MIVQTVVVALYSLSSFKVFWMAVAWSIWRLWTFTIKPSLRQHLPEELPYTVPFLGHFFAFWWDSGSVIEAASKITSDSQKPVAVYILGMKLYFVFDPSHVMATFRNTSTLSWDKFLDELMVLFGVKRAAIGEILHRHNPDLERFYSQVSSRPVKKMTLRHFTEALYMRQLQVDKADELSVAYFQSFLQTSGAELSKSGSLTGGTIRMPLQDLVEGTVSRSVAQMLFGSVIFDLEKDLTKHSVRMADELWRIVYQYPKWLAREFHDSYEHVMVAIERFSVLDSESQSSASFMIRTMLEAEKLYDLDRRSAAVLIAMMYIAAVSNVQTTTFWLLSYLLFDRELYTAIQEEIGPAFHDGVFDTNYIIQKCPLLMSTYSEVLRLHISSNSVRVVAAPTKFGDKILQPGNILMVPFAHMHRNSRAWGQDHAKFDPTRFLHTEKANPSFRPFGAGGNSCPGKAFAIRQVLSSVAYLMQTYDLRAPHIDGKPQSMPVAIHSTPTIGTSVPNAGKDLVVELTPGVSEPVHHIIAVGT